MNCFSENAYNQFSNLTQMQYKIIEHLIFNNENIWKLLKYPDSNALGQENLTVQDKIKLIYKGEVDSKPFRIFKTRLIDDGFEEQCSLLKIYPAIIIPEKPTLASVSFSLDVLSHIKIGHLNNGDSRNVLLMSEILKTLNGADINGVGFLTFNQMGSRYDKATLDLSNGKSYEGYSIVMSTRVSGVD